MFSANYKLSIIVFLFISTFFSFPNLMAQKAQLDPLNKPNLWKKIETNPKDMRLWAEYVGKNLNSLTNEDENNIIKWCSQITKDIKHDVIPEDVWMDIAENHNYSKSQKIKMDIEYKIFHKQMKDEVLQDSPIIKELTSNIETNFIIIEDMISLEFEELGTDYVAYHSKYPKNDYPKDKWITEKREELVELKLLNLKLSYATASNSK